MITSSFFMSNLKFSLTIFKFRKENLLKFLEILLGGLSLILIWWLFKSGRILKELERLVKKVRLNKNE